MSKKIPLQPQKFPTVYPNLWLASCLLGWGPFRDVGCACSFGECVPILNPAPGDLGFRPSSLREAPCKTIMIPFPYALEHSFKETLNLGTINPKNIWTLTPQV